MACYISPYPRPFSWRKSWCLTHQGCTQTLAQERAIYMDHYTLATATAKHGTELVCCILAVGFRLIAMSRRARQSTLPRTYLIIKNLAFPSQFSKASHRQGLPCSRTVVAVVACACWLASKSVLDSSRTRSVLSLNTACRHSHP